MPTAYTNRPALNFDAPEPVTATDTNASALFPQQPVYARTPSRRASNNLPILVGVPVVAVVAGGLIWAMTANRAEAPTDQRSLQTAAAESPAPLKAPLAPEATPSPIPQPTEVAANDTPAPAPVARTTTPRAAPVRAVARRAALTEASAPDASSASSNVSATVPAAPTVSAAPAPAVAEPAPLVVPAPTAPTPAPATEPSNPM